MGNATSSALSKEILDDLKLSTIFTETEICQWYENFQKQCPTGRITPEEFEQIYTRFFPESDAKSYARHVFRSFDTNDDGTLDFKEYIIALHMTSTGKTTRKLEWAFSLFDVDKNGYISKTEVTEICQVRRPAEDCGVSHGKNRFFMSSSDISDWRQTSALPHIDFRLLRSSGGKVLLLVPKAAKEKTIRGLLDSLMQ